MSNVKKKHYLKKKKHYKRNKGKLIPACLTKYIAKFLKTLVHINEQSRKIDTYNKFKFFTVLHMYVYYRNEVINFFSYSDFFM